jgi:hypothetical protein
MLPKFQSPLDDPVLSGVMGPRLPLPLLTPPRRPFVLFVARDGEYDSCFIAFKLGTPLAPRGGYRDCVVGEFVVGRDETEGAVMNKFEEGWGGYVAEPYFEVAVGLGPASAAFNFPSAFSDLDMLLAQWGLSANVGPCRSVASLLNRLFV